MKRFLVVSLLGISSLVSACGSADNSKPQAAQNPAYINKLKQMVVTPKASFDPTVVNATPYQKLEVVDAKGDHVTLNASQQPVMLVAYWCPHCQRTLVMMNQNQATLHRLPILVSMGFADGTSLRDAVKLTEAEKQDLHLSGFQVYYILGTQAKNLVPDVIPVLFFRNGNSLAALSGEHTLSIWEKALNQ